MYCPTLGRFLQTDPIGYDDGLNWYAYVGNDPVNGRDPTGQYVCKGDEKQCGAVTQGLARARQAIESGKLSKEEVKRLQSVLKTFGDAGKNNGIFVSFRSPDTISRITGGRGVGTAILGPKTGAVNIILPTNFARYGDAAQKNPFAGGILKPDRYSPQDDRANILAHEGTHARDIRATNSYTDTALSSGEKRAYDVGGSINKAFGTLPGVQNPYGPDQYDDD